MVVLADGRKRTCRLRRVCNLLGVFGDGVRVVLFPFRVGCLIPLSFAVTPASCPLEGMMYDMAEDLLIQKMHLYAGVRASCPFEDRMNEDPLMIRERGKKLV